MALTQCRIGPRWTWDSSFEKPAGIRDMGSWKETYYTKEQQMRLGVDQYGKDAPVVRTKLANAIGPRWTWDSTMEKPAGEKNMGSFTQAVYTKEQQKRLGVDMNGKKAEKPIANAVGPRWTWDSTMEKPAGEKNMGSFTQAVYTKEQQERLGVDLNGHAIKNNRYKLGWGKHM